MSTPAAQIAPGRHSVGAALKGRRQEMRLSVQDIAAQMRLDPRIIEALEADRFEALPAPLYVRGYIRGYAKILKLDPGALVEVYDADAPSAPPEIVPEVKHPTQTSSRDKPVRAFTYAVTFTLVILVVAWWQSSFVVRSAPPAAPPATQAAADAAPPAPARPAPAAPPAAGTESPVPAPADAAPAQTQGQGQTEDAGASAAEPITGGVPGPDRVVFHLSSDSWVEVFDSTGDRLYMSLARAGETVSLTGTAPFSVVLGYAQGVNVEFNGHPFDPGPFSHSGIARFTLSH